MKNCFAMINALVPSIPGWCTVQKAMNLACLIGAKRPELSLEIGIFAGRSLIPMALAHQSLGKGKVVGVDPWDAAESIKHQSDPNVKWWSNQQRHQEAEAYCRLCVHQNGLGEFVEIVKSTSEAYPVPMAIGVLHIDGNHSEQAVREVSKFGPAVEQGGYLVLDDLDWDTEGPLHALKRAKTMGFTELYRLDTDNGQGEKDNYAVLQRT